MKKVLKFIGHEFLEMLAPSIYFLIIIYIVGFVRGLAAEEYSLSLPEHALAIVSALIAGKAILIADATPLSLYFSRKRLIYNIIWRTVLYTLIVLIFQILEEFIPLFSKYKSISMAFSQFREEVNWLRFWSTHISFVLFLFIYNLITGIAESVGKREFTNILISPMNKEKDK
jgi:hypothetical protein